MSSLKVILAGNTDVGKTSLTSSFLGQEFDSTGCPTITSQFRPKSVEIDGSKVELQIWDTAGQERYVSMTQFHFRNANAAIICFCSDDVPALKKWADRVLKETPLCKIFAVLTKCDLLCNDAAGEIQERVAPIVQELRADFFATSARTGEGVVSLLNAIARFGLSMTQLSVSRVPIGTNEQQKEDCSC
jgi:Ras-related protein Rab-8A